MKLMKCVTAAWGGFEFWPGVLAWRFMVNMRDAKCPISTIFYRLKDQIK